MMDTRENILNAAERIVADSGVKNLSFDSISRVAKISRGGVLYHFPSKELVIEAMLQRLVGRFERILEDEMLGDDQPGRFSRAFVRASLRVDEETIAVYAPILAALAYEPALLKAFSQPQKAWTTRMRAELDPAVADVLRLSSFAMWMEQIVSAQPMSLDERGQVVDYLQSLTR